MEDRLSLTGKVLLVVGGVLLVTGGIIGFQQAANPAQTEMSEGPEGEESGSVNASYNQSKHMGCQAGAITKDGSCSVAVSGQNAEIFQAEGLEPVTSENTSMNGIPGYLVRPDDNGTYPSVVMMHEWWGLNGNIRHMADILAGHGYTVFAVDLYDGEVATNSSTAARLSGQVRDNPDEAVEKMSRATDAIREKNYTNNMVSSLGWCFGGGQSLQLSLSDTELNSTVIYYGTLTTNQSKLENVDQPVLGIFGSEDNVVGLENVKEFNSTLDSLGTAKEIHVYEGAGHAFANPSGESFRPNATQDAWNKTLKFLDENLKQN